MLGGCRQFWIQTQQQSKVMQIQMQMRHCLRRSALDLEIKLIKEIGLSALHAECVGLSQALQAVIPI